MLTKIHTLINDKDEPERKSLEMFSIFTMTILEDFLKFGDDQVVIVIELEKPIEDFDASSVTVKQLAAVVYDSVGSFNRYNLRLDWQLHYSIDLELFPSSKCPVVRIYLRLWRFYFQDNCPG